VKKVCLVVALTALFFLGVMGNINTEAASLNDIQRHWAQGEVEYLVDSGLITGYSDGSFKPNKNITRAEAAKIISEELGLAKTDSDFPDVRNDYWANGYIGATAQAGIINGFSDGSFDPKGSLTRAEMAKILSVAYSLPGQSSVFSDTSDNWAYDYIQKLAANNITNGYNDGTFRPQKNITRAEFATFESRVLNDKFKPSTQETTGALSAIVEDSNRSPVKGVRISIYDSSGKLVTTDVTNIKGQFSTSLPEETYSLKAELDGYEAVNKNTLQVTKENTLGVPITLVQVVDQPTYTFLELNKPYISSDNGMTVEVTKVETIDAGDYYEYRITYTETNKTSDKVITQGSFKIYYKNGESEPQYGFFNDLYPGETSTRSYTFKSLKSKEPLLIEYGADLFFNSEPSEGTLKWKIPVSPS
jgi:hypothetical protein